MFIGELYRLSAVGLRGSSTRNRCQTFDEFVQLARRSYRLARTVVTLAKLIPTAELRTPLIIEIAEIVIVLCVPQAKWFRLFHWKRLIRSVKHFEPLGLAIHKSGEVFGKGRDVCYVRIKDFEDLESIAFVTCWQPVSGVRPACLGQGRNGSRIERPKQASQRRHVYRRPRRFDFNEFPEQGSVRKASVLIHSM